MSGPTNSSRPTTAQVVGGVYNASTPAPVDQQALALQQDNEGNLLVNIAAGDVTVSGSLSSKIEDTNGNPLNSNGAGALKVDGSAVTQPVSGTVAISNFPSTQPVSGSVAVTNFPATQPVSAASLPLPANAAQETGGNLATVASAQGTNGTGITQPTGGAGILGWLSGIYNRLAGVVLAAGTAIIGKVGIDQTTPGTTNGVQVNAALPAGTNEIGHVIADSGSTTAVTGNVTVVQGTGTNLHVVVDSAPTTAVTLPAGQAVELLDSGGTNKASISAAGAIKVDGSAVTQPASLATLPALVAGSAIIGKVGIDQTTPGTTNGVQDASDGPVAAGTAATKSSLQGGVFSTTAPAPTNGQQVASQFDAAASSLVSTEGRKATYAVGSGGLSTIANAINVYLSGSSTKVIKVTRIGVAITASSAALQDVQVIKYSSLPTGGTVATPGLVPYDSSDGAATASAGFYTAAPVSGSLIGAVRFSRFSAPGSSTGTVQSVEWDFGGVGAKPIVLRGAAQCITLVPAIGSQTMDWYMEWTEE